MSISLWDGTEERAGTLLKWDGTEELACQIARIPQGINNVTHLLSHPDPIVVTHRCGSLDWAEYSKRGLTESVIRGVHAIEVSVAITSDGVLFGLHDEDLDRTSNGTFPPADQMTWAQVQAELCFPAAGGDPAFGPQPYVELEDLISPYLDSHCIFLDLKHQANTDSTREKVLSLLNRLYDVPQDRVVFKFPSGDNTPYADWASSHGYVTWAHFRTVDYIADPVQVMADADHWTWLGIDSDATAQMWLDFQATGKPLLGAVIESAAERDIVLGEGVFGYMLAAVRLLQGDPVI